MQVYNTPAPEESEDCLLINVFAPATPATGNGRAVLFWIYGGALQFGHGGHPVYDGSHFAAYEDVIVVAANYRLNGMCASANPTPLHPADPRATVFGFPNSPEVRLEDRNLGFLDQRFALDWVQRNIHAFGGDPDKVTLFGESAGAFSIDALLTSYPVASNPPFRAAILQSGQLSYRGNPSPGKAYPDGRPSWDALAAALNCTGQSNLTCISAAPATTIKDIIEKNSLFLTPTIDNQTYLADLARERTSGRIARIPLLSGTNANEGRALVLGQDNVTAYLQSTLGNDANPDSIAAITAAYPVGGAEFPTAFDAIAEMETHVSFQCGAALVANDTAALGTPTWRYMVSFPDYLNLSNPYCTLLSRAPNSSTPPSPTPNPSQTAAPTTLPKSTSYSARFHARMLRRISSF
jgi:carboxylesterase type B